ncbi:thiol:disulfide interchange protein [Hapalosiphon sp. MRB220]|nr:thiol:disulfide interchange protein [Hapalosiphon sp. MRB220]
MSINTSENSPAKSELNTGTRIRNFLVAIVAIALSVTLVLGLKSQTNTVSLTQLGEESTPLEVALTNGKPSLVEFYANWCTVCQKMAPTIATLEKQYTEKVNFVMLNVDNNKWLPEMLKYRVDGIPHFVYLSENGESVAQAIGDQPSNIMASNLEALVVGSPLPYAQANGQVSKVVKSVPASGSQDDPRSHGSQVVN